MKINEFYMEILSELISARDEAFINKNTIECINTYDQCINIVYDAADKFTVEVPKRRFKKFLYKVEDKLFYFCLCVISSLPGFRTYRK
jgi:hypothetical protein